VASLRKALFLSNVQEHIYKSVDLVFGVNEPEEVPRTCHLNEKAEEDPKEAKAAAAWYNALTADNKCQETKLRGPPAEFHSLNPS
jgi:hypothetical protein